MSLNVQDRNWHDKYESLHDEMRDMIDEAYKEVTTSLGTNGFKVAGDDRAERLVAAITRYVCECNPELM